jgi:hypothetical protein
MRDLRESLTAAWNALWQPKSLQPARERSERRRRFEQEARSPASRPLTHTERFMWP